MTDSVQPPVGTAWHRATFLASFGRFWRGYTVFSGRAARAEFWWWALWWYILASVAQIPYVIGILTWRPQDISPADEAVMEEALRSMNPFPVWGTLLSSLPPVGLVGLLLFALLWLAALLPWIAVIARRLHDTNRSGWWVLLAAVPVGNVVLVVFLTIPSDERGARFDGPSGAGQGEAGPGGTVGG
ncbi:MAG: DUF805 domain-containing protein [Curtobacterium sp.]